MLTYADVVFGRLLLLESLIGVGQVLELASQGAGPKAPALQVLVAESGHVDGRARARLAANVPIVLRAERERALARLLHLAGVLPQAKILEVFEVVRGTSFEVDLGSRLIERGLLDASRVEQLYSICDSALRGARHARERELQALALNPPDLAQAQAAVSRVFQLCEDLVDLAPRVGEAKQAAQLSPVDPLAAAMRESSEALRVAPEDCPIYGYEIVEELGKGAMGVVYKARHIFTNRSTALKVLPLRLAAKTQYLERFKREAMAVMRLQHENVVRAYDFGGSEEYYYLALEFVEGETLDAVLQREGRLEERRALEVGAMIARALGCAFEHGVIHRDVKPENIMLTREGVAKLCDFGIVKLKDMDEGALTMAGTTVGTPFYISPEQARGEDDVDIRSDLYALGITLFHLATGEVPFRGKSQGAILVRHILEEVPDPRTKAPGLSEGFAAIVGRLTRKKREDRFETPAQVVEAIEAELSARV